MVLLKFEKYTSLQRTKMTGNTSRGPLRVQQTRFRLNIYVFELCSEELYFHPFKLR